MTKDEALKLALEALEWNLPVIEDHGVPNQLKMQHKAITSIYESLAQPEQEPVAWRREYEGDVSDLCQWLYADEYDPKDDSPNWQPLYTNPPHRKPLTDEEIETIWQNTSPYYDHQDFARDIEAAHGIKEEA